MAWVLKLEEVRDNKIISRRKVMSIERPARIDTVDDVGLRIGEAKKLLSSVQQLIAASQFRADGTCRSICAECGSCQQVKDYRSRAIDSLYGRITVRCARYRCTRCGLASLPTLERSTTEYDTIRARLAAHLPYRVVADILTSLLPVDAGAAHTTIRNCTARVANLLEQSSACVDERYAEPVTRAYAKPGDRRSVARVGARFCASTPRRFACTRQASGFAMLRLTVIVFLFISFYYNNLHA